MCDEVSRPGLTGIVRLPSRSEAVRGLSAAALIAVICWFFGVDAWHSILLGCAITVAILAGTVMTSSPEAEDLSWRHGKGAGSEGSRNDVANLSYSLNAGWGRVGLTAGRRLHQIARRRLALEGLDLQNADHGPAIERRIGRPAYRILMRSDKRRLRLGTLMSCLDALDAIDSTHYPAPQPGSRRRRPNLIPARVGRTRER